MAFDAATRAYTTSWWERLLKDEEAMGRWLVKLQRTEFEGLQDNLDAAAQWAPDPSSAAHNIFIKTGEDELRHAELLLPVLAGRGLTKIEPDTGEPSVFWTRMMAAVVDLHTCAAVLHIGEQLAADRFEVIQAHPDTPDDVRRFISQALPDEAYHARSFGKLAGYGAIARMEQLSVVILAEMKSGSK